MTNSHNPFKDKETISSFSSRINNLGFGERESEKYKHILVRVGCFLATIADEEIDKIVYELYNLTQEEINIIENNI